MEKKLDYYLSLFLTGYADPVQYTRGVHTRLYARCFVFANANDSKGKRAVFCSGDLPMLSQNIKRHVIALLQKDYGDLYTHDNVMLSGTHTHSYALVLESYSYD